MINCSAPAAQCAFADTVRVDVRFCVLAFYARVVVAGDLRAASVCARYQRPAQTSLLFKTVTELQKNASQHSE